MYYHEREGDGSAFDALDDPHGGEADDLDEREHVNSTKLHVTQEDVVRLIFDRHKNDQQAIVELHTHAQV